MTRKTFLVVALFCFIIGLFGCAAVSQRDRDTINPALLEPQAIARFSDVPVPVGFKFIPQESYSFETSGVRMGLLRYRGKGNPDLVVNFYREQMEMYNWRLLNVVEYGQRLMNFDRETETCIVNIMPRSGSVEITIAVGPKAQGSKKAKPVVK